jgi:hypothetical protein
VALLPLRGLLPLARRRLDEASLDPELAEAKPLVGFEIDLGPGEQRVIVSPGMLEQVSGQLLLERALISLELLPILAGEPDRVLVRHVHAGDRRRAMRVHLLGQLAGDLHWLDLG